MTKSEGSWKRVCRHWPWHIAAACLILTPAHRAIAQDNNISPDVLRRLDALEKRLQASEDTLKSRTAELENALSRIQQLESRLETGSGAAQSAAVDPPPKRPEPAPEAPAPSLAETTHDHDAMEIASTPRMSIRGFGDVRFGREVYGNSPNSFAFGQLDLYITSRLSERTSMLMETVFESDTSNALGVDVERILLQHRLSRYLKLEAGRNHTAIGYYNMAYHHGTWFQTGIARPFLFAFEDEGGLLPIHMVGLRATGALPGAGLGLEYFAEIGNGRNYNPAQEQVQNRIDYDSGKAFNFAIRSSPDAVPGLHIGTSYFRQQLQWNGFGPLQQSVLAGFAVYDHGRVEFLNEAVWLRHHANSGATTSIPGGYSEFAYRFGAVHPYVRYEYLNAVASDPIARLALPSLGLRQQVSGGIRYDFTEFAAIKFQYGRLLQGSQIPVNLFATQAAFTF